MSLIVCCICDRQKEISPIKRIKYRCLNCGVEKPQIIHRRKNWQNWEENAGIIKIEAMRRAYAGLKWLAENKHFNPKYPLAKFRGIFGAWPPDEIMEAPAYAPTPGLLRWINASNQRWKKQKAAEEKKEPAEVVLRLVPEGQGDVTPSFMTAEDWNVKL